MEFYSDSPNIQIKFFETFNSTQLSQNLIYKYNKVSLEQINKKSYYMIDCNINLNDYYLINNVKINLENIQSSIVNNQIEINNENEKNNNINNNILNEIILANILFLYPDYYINNNNDISNNDDKYDIPYYYNPDKEDIIMNKNNEISIFCIGATNHICFRFLVKKKIKLEEITKNKKYITKYIIYSQYIYSIPNATFLMTLLNLKNFFYNLKNNKELNKSNDKIKIKNNYYCSMYLTAISMIQARLFIQAWEMLTILQTEILSYDNNILEKNKFLKIMFEIKHRDKNYYPVKKIYLTKLELIKAICMFEHGHTQIFLDCLKNSIDIFYNNKYIFLGGNICLNKVNEIAQDKIHIQGLLSRYGNKIVDILINFLKDKNEMILYSVLKIIEFFIDYNPIITYNSIHKIIKFISKVSYDIYKNKNNNENNEDNINKNIYDDYLIIDENEENNINQNDINNSNNNTLEHLMKEKGILFPYELYNSFKKEKKENKNNKDEKDEEENIDINKIYKFNSISQVLQKQINYTLDTIIQNMTNFDANVINNILKTCSPFLFSILKISPKDSLIYVCSLKILKKCYMNNESNLYFLNYRNILNLFFFGIKPNLKDIFKEYIKIQKNIYKNKSDFHTTKKIKENLQNINLKNNYINSLLNTNALIENNDYGNLITIIFDRISEIFVHDFSLHNLSQNKNCLYGGIDYISNCIRYIKTCLEIIKTEKEKIEIDSDFLIFYIYLLLEFIIIIYLSNNKKEIKKNLLNFYLGKDSKYKSVLFQKIEELISILFDLEEYTLTNISSYLLFEPILDILSRIKYLYKSSNNNSLIKFPSYDNFFLKQYENLYNFISRNGITYDNIRYLLKTLPLADVENAQFIFYFKKILNIFLINFDNYYTEESFNLFSLTLEKSSQFIDENIFEKITNAILNKSNYKGKIFNQCYFKYNEIILKNEKGNIFNLMIKQFEKAIIEYKTEMEKNKGNKILFKAKYIKFIDRIELIRKFYEYMKNNINRDIETNMWKFNLLQQESIMKKLIDVISIADDTTTSKINLLFVENFLVLDYKNNKNNKNIFIEKNNEINKEQNDINENNNNDNSNNNNDNENININNNEFNKNNVNIKKDLNNNINENNNDNNEGELYSEEQIQVLKNILINSNAINEYLVKINSKENLYLLNENLKLMNKIIQIINGIDTKYIKPEEKYILFTKYYNSINRQHLLKMTKIPNLLDELLLFYYQITIPLINNEITNNDSLKDYLSIIKEILYVCFNINDNDMIQNNCNMNLFGIEILLKLFDIKLNIKEISFINNIYEQNILYLKKEEMIEQKQNINNIYNTFDFSIFDSFFEATIKLLDNIDYQIFFLLEFILNMIIPEDKKPKLNSLIDSLNINNVWIEKEEELFDLYNFIQEKLINNKIIENKNIMNNSDFIGINLDEDNEKDDGYIEKDIIVDEVNDEDNDFENDNDTDNLNDIVFPEEKNEEINIIQQDNNNFGNNIINQINTIENINGQDILNNLISNGNINPELLNIIYQNNNINNNALNNLNENDLENNNIDNINNNNININNLDKNEEDLSLEELGVKEVDDDIFGENFDESKVPILKKNNVRCKGYAAKFKTNQNSRPLLMSEHVRDNNSKNSNNDSNNNLNIENNNNNNNSNNSGNNLNLSINKVQNKNNIIIPLNEKEKEKTESDFNDAPDLTQKKKNIRPLNGFRPATPPLKDAFSQQMASNTNFNNIFNNNNNNLNDINKNNNSIEPINKNKNKIEIMKNSQMNNISSVNNKKAKEKGKISSSRRQSNKVNKHHKKKERKTLIKYNRSKSEEIMIKNRYVLKGVELFIRKNKKNKKKKKSKNDVNNINENNKKIEMNKKEIKDIKDKKENISKKNIDIDNININSDKNIQIKINKEKEQKIEDEDDIIFSDFLKLENNINNEHKEDENNEIQINKNKNKYIQRPNDKKKNTNHSLNLK